MSVVQGARDGLHFHVHHAGAAIPDESPTVGIEDHETFIIAHASLNSK
jgi:hypothetical protein